jgi:D-glutamate cyclase
MPIGHRVDAKIALVRSAGEAPNSLGEFRRGTVMLDMVGEAVDRLITIEAKNHGMPHGILQPMYDAARKAAGNKPVTMAAAKGLKKHLGKGDVVFIMTGAGYEPTMPKGESDGPPGAASLARILYRGLGAIPVFVNEECHADPIVASSEAAGLMVKPFDQARDRHLGAAIVNAPAQQSKIKAWISKIYADYKPKAVVSTERLGAGADGNVHTATGLPLTGPKSKFQGCIDIGEVVTEANRRNIFSVGIGDHGNELGFGTIYDTVVKTMPKGSALATVVKTDVVIPAMMSNWGCYGIEACLAYLLRKPQLIHSPAMEKRIVQACLDAGGLEAMYCTTEFLVDGLDGETSMACMQFLSNIVRKNLEPPDAGLTH